MPKNARLTNSSKCSTKGTHWLPRSRQTSTKIKSICSSSSKLRKASNRKAFRLWKTTSRILARSLIDSKASYSSETQRWSCSSKTEWPWWTNWQCLSKRSKIGKDHRNRLRSILRVSLNRSEKALTSSCKILYRSTRLKLRCLIRRSRRSKLALMSWISSYLSSNRTTSCSWKQNCCQSLINRLLWYSLQERRTTLIVSMSWLVLKRVLASIRTLYRGWKIELINSRTS